MSLLFFLQRVRPVERLKLSGAVVSTFINKYVGYQITHNAIAKFSPIMYL